jgi:hypothetical protein
MGSSLAIAAQRNGHSTYYPSSDRSLDTNFRAHDAGIEDLLTIENIARSCDVIISICMGAGVMPNAKAVIEAGFSGIYVDANHIGNQSYENHLKEMITSAGISYVDSAIYGWPYPHESDPHGERTIYLCGPDAETVAGIIGGDIFDAKIVDVSAKEIKRQREISDRADCAPHINHGYGVVEFPDAIAIDDKFIDAYIQRRELAEPQDYSIDDEGFYVNRGGYRFTKDQVEAAPKRFLNLTPDNAPEEDIAFCKEIEIAIAKCINAYRGIYPEVYDCVRWRTDAHIATYPPGAGMGMHHDNAIGGASKNENPIFNVLSLSLILSDRCTGGDLVLKYINKAFKPQKGTVIIYPSGFLGSHAVSNVETGLRVSYLEFFGHGTVSGQTKPI